MMNRDQLKFLRDKEHDDFLAKLRKAATPKPTQRQQIIRFAIWAGFVFLAIVLLAAIIA